MDSFRFSKLNVVSFLWRKILLVCIHFASFLNKKKGKEKCCKEFDSNREIFVRYTDIRIVPITMAYIYMRGTILAEMDKQEDKYCFILSRIFFSNKGTEAIYSFRKTTDTETPIFV